MLIDVAQNKSLLDDELYLGLHQERVRGEKYDQFVDKFVQAVKKRYPKAYIHFVRQVVPKTHSLLVRILRASLVLGGFWLAECEADPGQVHVQNSLLQR